MLGPAGALSPLGLPVMLTIADMGHYYPASLKCASI